MKKFYFLLLLLLIPTVVSAKTVTCTSDADYTIGENVYDNVSVTCSEGDVELFAVEETSNELTWNPVVNPYQAVAGMKYAIEFVWTGDIDPTVDTMLVDGEDLTSGSYMCDTGCHLYTKALEPHPANNSNTGEEKEIAVGTIYYVGDSIKFDDILIILYADEDGTYLEAEEGSYVLPEPELYYDDLYNNGAGIWVWAFENFLKEYDESGLHGLYFGYSEEIDEEKVPVGIKCISGVGTVNDPFTFELVYEYESSNQGGEEPTVPGNPDESQYTILEGDNQTYIKGSKKDIVIKASGDKDKVAAIEIDNGNPIDPTNYELESGSTILTLKADFLENSSLGEHTITFRYDDGEVSAKLTVAEEDGAAETDTDNPPTGDNIMFYVSILSLSILVIAGIMLYQEKKENN